MKALKKYLLTFGYGRWSKIRSVSKHSCQILEHKIDEELRSYSHKLILFISETIPENVELQEKLLKIIQVKSNECIVNCTPSDFAENI